MIEALLDCRATLDQRDSSGATPLHFAAMNAKVDVVKLLLDRGGLTWVSVGKALLKIGSTLKPFPNDDTCIEPL